MDVCASTLLNKQNAMASKLTCLLYFIKNKLPNNSIKNVYLLRPFLTFAASTIAATSKNINHIHKMFLCYRFSLFPSFIHQHQS